MQGSSNAPQRCARAVSPGSPSNTAPTGRGSIGRADLGVPRPDGTRTSNDIAPLLGSSNKQQQASRRSLAYAASVVRYVDAGDIAGFENFVKQLSPSQLALAFAPERTVRGTEDARSPVVVAVKTGNLQLIRAVLRWIPDDQTTTVLLAKGESDGKTVLMLAAATGEWDVFEEIAKMIPRAHIQEQMSAQCVMGNTICMYAVKTGRPDVIEAIIRRFPSDQVIDALCVKNFLGENPLMHAARASEPGAFAVIAKLLPTNELTAQLEAKTEEGQTALQIATRAGHVSTWRAVASAMSGDEMNRQVVATDIYGETLVILSVRSGNATMFYSVVGRLTGDQVLMQLGARNKQGQTPAQVAVACGAESVLAAMVRPGWVSACQLDAPDESEAQLTALDLAVRPPAKVNMLRCLLACGATPTPRVILKLTRNSAKNDGGDRGGCGEVNVVRECFVGAVAASEWAPNPLIPGLNMSVALIEASRQSSDLRQVLKNLLAEVDALVLSVLRHLPDTVAGFDRLAAPSITKGVALRRLPRVSTLKKVLTVGVGGDGGNNKMSLGSTIARGVPRISARIAEGAPAPGVGITLVQEMLEPELAGRRSRNCAGPLAQAVQSRHLEFLCTSLVVDYLRLKFSAGLPNPFRDTEWRREHRRMDRDLARFMLDEDESKLRVYILQGGCADSPSWTYLPGLQFILAGLVGKTAAFFGVPAMRLALDVVVYFGVIAVFVTKVMVLQEAGNITPWEILWLVYLLGAVWQQVREVQEAGSIRMHFFNAWNLVEATMLASLSVAMVFRVWAFACDGEGRWFCGDHGRPDDADVSHLNEVYLAQYFQAASAPFVLGRVLFLTQIHSSLGPLMHSTFQVFTDLAQFGALMLFIVLGFALAFYAMFGSKSASLPEGAAIEQYDTFFSSMLTLFGSMLGNFDFTVFEGAPLGEAGVVLLVFFLCVMNVTLLNLLIAILATAHAKVESNADKEAMLSEALIITQYRRAMRSDSLPSPLNVPQELVCHLFWRHKERTKEVFARAVFWFISGPIAIASTAVLWAVSLPLTLAWGYRVVRSNGAPMLVPALLGIGFNLGLAPVVTAWLWIEGVVGVWRQTNGSIETSDLNEIEASRAHRRRHLGSASVSPAAASIATAAVAALAKTGTVNTVGAYIPLSPGHNRGGGSSNAWKQAADKSKRLGNKDYAAVPPAGTRYDEGSDSGATQQQGFDVAAAVRSLHGLTIQQLRERLDRAVTSPCREKEEVQRRYDSFAKALEKLQNGHDRLEAMIRKSDISRVRVENKLDQLINTLAATSNANKSEDTAATAASSSVIVASPSASPRAGRREVGIKPGVVFSVTQDRGGGDDPPGETSDGLDAFIDDYHAGVSGR